MIVLENWRFRMEMNPGSKADCWRIEGEAWGHPEFPNGHTIMPSAPVNMKETEQGVEVEGFSGRQYLLSTIHPEANREQMIAELRAVVQRGGRWEYK